MAGEVRNWIGRRVWESPSAEVLPRIRRAMTVDLRTPWGRTGRSIVGGWYLARTSTGAGLIRIGASSTRWRERRPGTTILLPPGTVFWEDATSLQEPAQMSSITFLGGELAGLPKLLGKRRFAEIEDPAGLLETPLRRMAILGHTLGEGGFWRAQACLARLLDLLTCVVSIGDGLWAACPAPPATLESPGLVKSVAEYFRSHLDRRLTIKEVARHVHMSVSSFSHCYTKVAGMSPMLALAELRMEVARELLEDGVKLDIIARQTGFYDAFHFSKVFRRHHGVPPSQFRAEMLNPAGHREPRVCGVGHRADTGGNR